MNKDDAELARFNALARDFWDPTGPMKPLHMLNPLRVDWIEQQHGSLVDAQVLDIGCGGGLAAEAMAARGAHVTGLDGAEKLLKAARIHAADQGIDVDYQLGMAEDWANQHAGEYELVTCLEMLEHVPDPASVIESIAALLAPGGTAVLSTLNRTLRGFALGIVAAEYILKWVEPGTHTYRKFIKPSELARMCRTHGLQVVSLTGVRYNPLRAMQPQPFELDRQDLAVNYFMSVRKPL
ncbi:MAG: bifunctional 2-polyprenyl-6-hydroxyphenol methylase/3-demethylubiquinol 3-O-methyltransferase UbiG [Litorivicinus sp.]